MIGHLLKPAFTILICLVVVLCNQRVIDAQQIVPAPEAPNACPTETKQRAPTNAVIALAQPLQTVPNGCKLELTLTLATQPQNPYDPRQADVQVRFVAPHRQIFDVAAFYNAQLREWRVRFTPLQAGRWRATALLQTNAKPTQKSRSISFTVSVRQTNGVVRVNSRNPRYLAFDNGRTFLPIGLNLGWWRNDALAEYTRWLDALHANGATVARVWFASWAFGVEWRDTGLGNYANREHRAGLFDAVLALAEQRGIYLIVGLLPDNEFRSDENGLWQDNPYNRANGGPCAQPTDFFTNPEAQRLFGQRLRYIAARWGYSPNILAWEFWNEVETTHVETAQLKPWIEAMSRVLKQYDVNHHLLTLSYLGNGDDDIWAMPEIDLVMRHEYEYYPKWFKPMPNGFRISKNMPNKPLVFGEFGARSFSEQLNAATRPAIHLHNGLWASAFNGFAVPALYWWWDDYVDAGNLWPAFKGITQFFKGEDIAHFHGVSATLSSPQATVLALGAPTGALLWLRNNAYNHADAVFKFNMSQSTGEPFLFEQKNLPPMTVDLTHLANGHYRVQWWDTQTGQIVSETQSIVSQHHLHLSVPIFNQDIAGKIQ